MPLTDTIPEKEANLDISARLSENGKGLYIHINLEEPSTQRAFEKGIDLGITANFSVNGLFIRKGTRFVKIPFSDILFLEASGSYTLVHTRDKQYTLTRNLTKICEGLRYPPFMRVHRSYTVNLMNIDSFSETLIYFSNREIPISGPYRKKLLNHFSCI